MVDHIFVGCYQVLEDTHWVHYNVTEGSVIEEVVSEDESLTFYIYIDEPELDSYTDFIRGNILTLCKFFMRKPLQVYKLFILCLTSVLFYGIM